jgi:hypothetical protein
LSRAEIKPKLLAWAVPAGVLLWTAGWTLARLGRPLWFDEASTAMVLLPKPLALILTDYTAPFNHLLYTCLLRLWSDLVGRGSPETLLRLPSIVFSIGAVAALLFGLKKPRGPLEPGAAWMAAALLACCPGFLLFSWQLRGYALSMLLSAAALGFYFRLGTGGGPGYALCGAAAIATLPTNLLLVGTLGLARLFSRPRPRLKELLWLASPLIGFVAYSAVMPELLGAATTSTIAGAAGHALGLAKECARMFAFAWPVLPFAAAGIALRGDGTGPARPAFAVLAATAPFAFVAVSSTTPYSRNLLVMLPVWCAVLGALVERSLRASKKLDPAKAAAVACAALALSGAWSQIRALTPEPDAKPQDLTRAYYDTKAFRPDLAVAFVKERKKLGRNDAVADDGDLMSLIYYARTTGGGPVYYIGHLHPEAYPKLKSRGEVLLIARSDASAEAIVEKLGAKKDAAPERLADYGFFSVYGLRSAAGFRR